MTNQYDASVTSSRIKARAKEMGMAISQLNSICDLSENTIKNAGKSTEGMKARNLYLIAETLDCSVDYLLGRTDEPQTKAETKTIEQNHQYIQNDSSFSIGVSLPPETILDRNQQELLKRYNQLEYEQQIEVMQMIIQKTKKESE